MNAMSQVAGNVPHTDTDCPVYIPGKSCGGTDGPAKHTGTNWNDAGLPLFLLRGRKNALAQDYSKVVRTRGPRSLKARSISADLKLATSALLAAEVRR